MSFSGSETVTHASPYLLVYQIAFYDYYFSKNKKQTNKKTPKLLIKCWSLKTWKHGTGLCIYGHRLSGKQLSSSKFPSLVLVSLLLKYESSDVVFCCSEVQSVLKLLCTHEYCQRIKVKGKSREGKFSLNRGTNFFTTHHPGLAFLTKCALEVWRGSTQNNVLSLHTTDPGLIHNL